MNIHYNDSIPNSIIINKLGPDIKVYVRYSNKAKRTFITIKNKIVELVLPNNNIKQAYAFLLAHEHWIRKKLSIEPHKIIIKPNIIPYFGKEYAVKFVDSPSSKVEIYDDIIQVYSHVANKEKMLVQFLKNILLIEITKTANSLAQAESLQFSNIKISSNKSSWGRCSSHGILSFNWRLVFVPPDVLDYVIVHEMCHLLEMNHSQKFWSLVSNLCPDYKIHKVWLRKNGLRLYEYFKDLK
ncbi:MAG: M48 family metallopeptidase [Rickettsiaceae bacterium]|nr:M48 family metallopeptidase [Rickettsiaceae bacterium]MDP4832464.1 M48 family metallopeptidase [Rickettsiaceae bacterium]MDP5020458.1 M48 family metallopeptidase [Rickettsiaceae bacterium]MDP5083090.1 M48 family metallopeptidase [Rickettsiaceae bacterium]